MERCFGFCRGNQSGSGAVRGELGGDQFSPVFARLELEFAPFFMCAQSLMIQQFQANWRLFWGGFYMNIGSYRLVIEVMRLEATRRC